MDAMSDNSGGLQCPTAIIFIGFFAGLFATSLVFNFVVVSALVVIVWRWRKRDHLGTHYTTKRSKNSYIIGEYNAMWSDKAPEYSRDIDEERSLEDTSHEVNASEGDDSKLNVENPHYASVKKTVRFTSV